jgi:starch-binding outer membrane protein, SusD/RagB family
MSGNYYWWGSEDTQYWNCNVSANNANLKDMSYSLWTVNAYANTIYDKLKGANASASVKSACMGECLTWKAMAYFYLVRTFGAVPIIHNNTDIIGAGTYNDQYKANIEDVYDYIIMTLKKAIELLPEKDPTGLGRIDKYSAEGLLAKVYLTKSGFDPATTTYEQGSVAYIKTTNHQRNQEIIPWHTVQRIGALIALCITIIERVCIVVGIVWLIQKVPARRQAETQDECANGRFIYIVFFHNCLFFCYLIRKQG